MSTPAIAFSPDQERRHWLHAVSGPLEILFVMGASVAAAMFVTRQISPGLGEALGMGSDTAPDFLAASRIMAIQIAAQYGVLFGLAALIGWLRGRRTRRAYALASPQGGVGHGLAYAVLLGLMISIIPSSVFILQDVAPIGADTPIWAALRGVEQGGGYWLFMAIGSFAIIPVVEELGWRGYVMGRLLEGYGPGAAMLATTLFFSLLHFQYLRPDAAMLLTFAGLTVASLGFALATLRTGSIWPAMIAHLVINLPMSTELHAIRILAAVVAVIVFRRAIARETAAFSALVFRFSSLAVLPLVGALGALAWCALRLPDLLAPMGAGLLLAALLTGAVRRSAWRAG